MVEVLGVGLVAVIVGGAEVGHPGFAFVALGFEPAFAGGAEDAGVGVEVGGVVLLREERGGAVAGVDGAVFGDEDCGGGGGVVWCGHGGKQMANRKWQRANEGADSGTVRAQAARGFVRGGPAAAGLLMEFGEAVDCERVVS